MNENLRKRLTICHGYRKKTRYILRYRKCDDPCRQPLIARIQ